ncbi:MAG: glycosyl hydrolase family 8 [Sphingobium sp.]
MDFDRRGVLIALGFAAMSGCARAETPKYLMPMLDPALWTSYKGRFVLSEGRVVDTGNGGISHSEGQGYGLLMAVAAGDRMAFDNMLAWTTMVLRRADVPLHSWRYEPGKGVTDPNNATDGDLCIAWALLNAGRKWRDDRYLKQAEDMRIAMANRLIVDRQDMRLLLPGLFGFEKPDHVLMNLSYYVWPALDAFAQIDRSVWKPVIDDGLKMLGKARYGPLKLPADWLDIRGKGDVEPAEGREPLFGFEGIRVPLYLAMSGRRAQAAPIARYWSGLIRAHQPIPATINIVTGETAPYPLSPGAQAVAARVTGLAIPGSGPIGDYYSSTLGTLNSIVLK